jgi:nucleotide-binding universal stress UspA family protein
VPAEALVRFVSGKLADAEKRHSPRLLEFRANARAFAFETDGSTGNGETETARRSTLCRADTEPSGKPFPVDLWPAEDVAPSARLTSEGKQNAFDLVLVGASDKSGFGFEALSRAVLGSVSRYVLENSPVPVLVVRARDARRASGFGNDAAYAPARKARQERKRFTPRDDDDSSAARGHARASSFPGNWRMDVDDDAEDPIAYDAVDGGIDRERNVVDAASSPSRGQNKIPASVLRNAPPPPLVGNAVCVAHDGGEDGIALVRWTLRTIFSSHDRALVIVHVAPGTSPDSLAKAIEATPVADALKTSDDDVNRFVAAFRDEDPSPSTAPASSTLLVSSHGHAQRGLGPFLPPGSGESGENDKWGLGALLLAASERSADVLVVGSRRLSSRLVAGGAARTCARLAPCAVLAVPADALEPFRRR